MGQAQVCEYVAAAFVMRVDAPKQEMARPAGIEPATPGLEGASSGDGKAVITDRHSIANTCLIFATCRRFYRPSDQAR